jgi:hypothetical protein
MKRLIVAIVMLFTMFTPVIASAHELGGPILQEPVQ